MPPHPWPIEREEALREAASDGYSLAQLAVILGMSRAAVSGKVKRLGVKLKRAKPSGWCRRPVAPRRAPRPPRIPKPAPVSRKPRIMSPYEPHPTTFLAVREFECRRLLGGDDNLPPYERLGAPVKAGSQLRFCEHCLEWLTVPVRGREAA